MTDASKDLLAMERWVKEGTVWGEASQHFVRRSGSLSLSSRELADELEGPTDGTSLHIPADVKSVLVSQLRALATGVDEHAEVQRDQMLPIAAAMAALRSLAD
jgi:hypothetical protein